MQIAESRLSAWVRRWRWLVAAFLVSCGLLLFGCGSMPKTHYYTLAISAAPPVQSDSAKTPWTLEVDPFRAVDVLQDDRIVYYPSANELSYYDYHRWSSEPGTLVAEFAAHRLNELGLFAQVLEFSHTTPADYVLRGRIVNFEEVDHQGGGEGRVGLELTLTRQRDHKVAWTGRREMEQPFQGKGMEGVVMAVNAATSRILDELLPGLAAAVEEDYKQSSKSFQK